MSVTILYDPTTLLHHSVELIGHKLIDAHESSSRIVRILKALRAYSENDNTRTNNTALLPFYKFVTLQYSDDVDDRPTGERRAKATPSIPATVHSPRYIQHLSTIFTTFLQSGAVDEDGCILPECFPHRALLTTVPAVNPSNNERNSDNPMVEPKLPRDPFAHLGHYSFDMSSGMSKDTFTSALAAVEMALKGVDMVFKRSKDTERSSANEGTEQTSQMSVMPIVFALTRPPGHHACHELAGGYCYINNAAVAAEYLLGKLPPLDPSASLSQSRLVILDLDFHHGNGTQSIFYNRREPAYISIHGDGEYPYYTGAAEEQGHGEGEGFNLNLPLASRPASSTEDYFRLLDQALNVIKEKWAPEYLLVSMGFDTFRKDILGGFELDVEDYRTIGSRIRALDLPVLILLEGGYSEELGDLVINFVCGLASE